MTELNDMSLPALLRGTREDERSTIIQRLTAEAEECECDGFSGMARGIRRAIQVIKDM